jgi:hypothetical protein
MRAAGVPAPLPHFLVDPADAQPSPAERHGAGVVAEHQVRDRETE